MNLQIVNADRDVRYGSEAVSGDRPLGSQLNVRATQACIMCL